MFYDTRIGDHGLPHNPFKSCVVPRPIGWISTLGREDLPNLAPYSQFQSLNFDPPYVMFSANQTPEGRRKDTTVNTEYSGEFVYNMATYDLREAVNITAEQVTPDVDEFDLAGLTKASPNIIRTPRVAESPIQLECLYHHTLRLPGNSPMGTIDIVIGEVVGIHIKDDVIREDGKIDIAKIRPLTRLGYYDYSVIDSVFEMIIPGQDKELLSGLEGAKKQ